MTVTTLKNALDLCREIEETVVGRTAILFVYQRRGQGQNLFAVFEDRSQVDLDTAPAVESYIEITKPAGGWPVWS